MIENISIHWTRGKPIEGVEGLEAQASKKAQARLRRAGVRADEAWLEYRRQTETAKDLPVFTYTGLAAVWLEAQDEAQGLVQDQLWGLDDPPLIAIRMAEERA